MNLISLLLVVLIVCVVLWGVRALLAAFSVGEPISTVIFVIAVILCLLILLNFLGLGAPGLGLRLR